MPTLESPYTCKEYNEQISKKVSIHKDSKVYTHGLDKCKDLTMLLTKKLKTNNHQTNQRNTKNNAKISGLPIYQGIKDYPKSQATTPLICMQVHVWWVYYTQELQTISKNLLNRNGGLHKM